MSITYLFGAGAESCFNVNNGNDFANTIINSSKYEKEIENYIKSVFNKIVDKHDFYPNYKKLNFSENSIIKQNIRSKFLNDFKDKKASKSQFDKDVDDEYNKVIKDKALKDKYVKQIMSGYLGLIDEDFFTLIEPRPLGPCRFWRVITYYYKAYLNIIECLLDDFNVEEVINNPKSTYSKVYSKCIDLLDKNKSYYSILKKYIDKNDYIVTTNYTPFCEILAQDTNLKPNTVSYTHGKLNLFESAYGRCVKNINECFNFEEDIYFPFLLLQSGIKPIIESKQITQYYNFINSLSNSNILIVIGYSFSIDDSDIIAMIREFLLEKDKKMIYFSYTKIDLPNVRFNMKNP